MPQYSSLQGAQQMHLTGQKASAFTILGDFILGHWHVSGEFISQMNNTLCIKSHAVGKVWQLIHKLLEYIS